MTTRSDFMEYSHLERKVNEEISKEIETGNDPLRLACLIRIQRHNFPTKEQAIAETQAFFKAEAHQ